MLPVQQHAGDATSTIRGLAAVELLPTGHSQRLRAFQYRYPDVLQYMRAAVQAAQIFLRALV